MSAKVLPMPQNTNGGVPPACSPEAEAEIIAGVAHHPEKSAWVPATLVPEHFFSEVNQQIWRARCECVDAGKLPSHAAIAEVLKSRKRLDAIEKLSEALRTATGTATKRQLEEHAALLIELASARRVEVALSENAGLVRLGRISAAEAVAAVAKLEVASSSAPRFKIWTAEEIWAPLPEPVFAIGGLLRQGNLALVVAFGSSLKTWLLTHAAITVATGQSFLERFECPDAGDVLIVDWESGDEELRRRLQANARALGLSGPVAGVSFVTMAPVYFTSETFEAELTALATGKRLVLFDSLAAGSMDVDENSAAFAKGLQIAKRVAANTGAAMLVLHHSRKDGANEETDERMSVRGTGAIFAAADVVLNLRRKTKGAHEDAFIVSQTKARGGKRVDPFLLRVEDVEPDAVRVFATDVPEEDEGAAPANSLLELAKTKVLSLLAHNHDVRSVNEAARRVSGRKATVIEAIAELEERKLVVRHEGAYRLSSEVR